MSRPQFGIHCGECWTQQREGSRVWLQEDDSLRCDSCQQEAMECDPLDLQSHGTAYFVATDEESLSDPRLPGSSFRVEVSIRTV